MFRRILVPLSGSEEAEQVLGHLVGLARWCNAELTLLHVLQPTRSRVSGRQVEYPDMLSDRAQSLVREYLAELSAELGKLGVQARGASARGDVVDTVTSRARAGGYDLIAVQTSGKGPLRRCLRGSTSDAIMVRSPLPVFVFNSRSTPESEMARRPASNLLVTLDGTSASEQALPLAHRLARVGGLGVTLIRVVPEFAPWAPATDEGQRAGVISQDARRACQDYLDRHASILAESGIDVATSVEFGRVASAITSAQARLPDHLLTIASSLRGGFGRAIFGSVADEVVRAACRPLLAVPSNRVTADLGPYVT
ncbi:MAG: universal stress protein [Chloroflexota bacterium]